jgi:hypothetical protein
MMIAIAKKPRHDVTKQPNERFLEMLPRIRSQARLAFRRLRPELKQELVQEVTVNAYVAYVRLVEQGKANIAYATPLANYAIRQVLAGRRVGMKVNSRDVSSIVAQRRRGFTLINFLPNSSGANIWCQILADNTLTPVLDQVAFRLDFPVWLNIQNRRKQALAKFLALGHTATEAAGRFRVSIARISQLRRELEVSWQAFQGEKP